MRVYLWFAGTTGLALTEVMRRAMRPEPAKFDYEIADILEKWLEQERRLRQHGDQYHISSGVKLNALRSIMDCKKEQFEAMEREAMAENAGTLSESVIDTLCLRIREYGQRRRLEEIQRKDIGDPMAVDQIRNKQGNAEGQCSHSPPTPSAPTPSSTTDEVKYSAKEWEEYVDAVGKGKGKGKGKCYNCNEPGHFAYQCPHAQAGGGGKSYGKAGQKGQRRCFKCGQIGHEQWQCPNWGGYPAQRGMPYQGQPVKGQGYGKGNSKGKGTYDVQHADQELGGGDVILELDNWTVVTKKHKDMRPISVQKGKKDKRKQKEEEWQRAIEKEKMEKQHSNRFAALSEDEISWIGAPETTDVDAVSGKEGTWERLPIKVDSGAVETVMPASMARHIPTRETNRSKNGSGFRAANGSHIQHYGQKALKGYGDEFQSLNIIAQVADVKTALASVYRMVQAGNMVHFEKDNCYIQHLETGTVTPMLEKNGGFEIGLWVESGLSAEQGFARQDS